MVCENQYIIEIFGLEEQNGSIQQQKLPCNHLSGQHLSKLVKKLSMGLYSLNFFGIFPKAARVKATIQNHKYHKFGTILDFSRSFE